MKLVLTLVLCALGTAAPKGNEKENTFELNNILTSETSDGRNILVNMLIRQMFEFLRRVINNGWVEQGFPVLDPLDIDNFHLVIPAGIINLDVQLERIQAKGFGQFVVHKSDLNLHHLTLDLDISWPTVNISADKYDLIGNLFSVVPLYGAGKAEFLVTEFTFQAKLYLIQSDDGKSILIDKIENTYIKIPNIKSNLMGVIGGGDISAIVNKVTEDVIFDYVNRFQGAIALVMSRLVQKILNSLLTELDSWKYIAVLLPHT